MAPDRTWACRGCAARVLGSPGPVQPLGQSAWTLCRPEARSGCRLARCTLPSCPQTRQTRAVVSPCEHHPTSSGTLPSTSRPAWSSRGTMQLQLARVTGLWARARSAVPSPSPTQVALRPCGTTSSGSRGSRGHSRARRAALTTLASLGGGAAAGGGGGSSSERSGEYMMQALSSTDRAGSDYGEVRAAAPAGQGGSPAPLPPGACSRPPPAPDPSPISTHHALRRAPCCQT